MIKAPVNKIIPSSVVDGPGNRTAIFFQSCNFNCRFCHNPETINMCFNCGECIKTCPVKALSFNDKNEVVWDKDKCVNCDTCIKTCRHNASPKIRYMTPMEVFEEIKPNLPFIRGITVSGGECTLQSEFIKELFKIAKEYDLGTLIDSNGSYDFINKPELLEYCDGVMLDIKADSEERHKWLTGHSLDIVIKNLDYLASIDKLEEIRTVCIPDSLDNEGTIELAGNILKPYLKEKDIRYKLIKYRHFGVRKQYQDFIEPSDEYMEALKKVAIKKGFRNIVII